MKALSFRQPWAELILQGRKTMDLRTYTTHYRGRIAIHASQTVEAELARQHQLNPDELPAGGLVGTVEVVDIIPLDPATYRQHEADHLAGRRFRPGLYGWVLARPERLPQLIPIRGHLRLFDVDLETKAGTPTLRAPTPAAPPELNGTTAEKPFALHLQPTSGSSTDYALTLRQRVVERPDAPPRLQTVSTISGDNLRAVADHVIEALRKADYKATDLTPGREQPFYLPEEVGVRLGLVFLTVKPLSKFRRVEEISYGIRQMPPEEAYYWYSKCTAADTAERAQKALRVLLAAE